MMMSPLLPTPTAAIIQRTLARAETLFREGDPTYAIFYVRRGRVRLVRHLADGSTVLLHIARDGDAFSEAALFSTVYHCDAIADVDSEIEIHPKDILTKSLNKDSQAAQTFMAHLARQVITLRSRLETRNIRSAKERVIQFLQLEGNQRSGEINFARPLKDIADEVGLTHEAFYRTLAQLEFSGKIARDGRTITLLS